MESEKRHLPLPINEQVKAVWSAADSIRRKADRSTDRGRVDSGGVGARHRTVDGRALFAGRLFVLRHVWNHSREKRCGV